MTKEELAANIRRSVVFLTAYQDQYGMVEDSIEFADQMIMAWITLYESELGPININVSEGPRLQGDGLCCIKD